MRVSVCAFGLCEGSCKPVGLAPIGILVATLQESCHKGQQLLLAFSMIGPRDAAFEVAVSSFCAGTCHTRKRRKPQDTLEETSTHDHAKAHSSIGWHN